MSTLLQFGGGVKSIQRGTIVISGSGVNNTTATITSVVTSKTELRLLGFYTDINNLLQSPKIELTDSTTITAWKGTTTGSVTLSWELTEYY